MQGGGAVVDGDRVAHASVGGEQPLELRHVRSLARDPGGEERVDYRSKLAMRQIRLCHPNELPRTIDDDVDQAALAIEHRLENRGVSRGDPRGANHSWRGFRVNACITLKARISQQATVAYGSADFVERNSSDHAVLIIDEETRTQPVVETFLDGDKDTVRRSADERKSFVGTGQR